MKSTCIIILFLLSVAYTASGQDEVEKPWTTELGISRHLTFENFTGINFRLISPAFRITGPDHYWTEEEEKHPEKFKKVRIMLELLYAPPFDICSGNCRNFIRIDSPGILGKSDSIRYYVANTAKISEHSGSLNIQYRIVKYKRLNVQLCGGLKFFFLTSPDYGLINSQRTWYLNGGLITQVDLGALSPFFDIGMDGIYTLGAEVNFNPLSKKGKKRYKLYLKKKK